MIRNLPKKEEDAAQFSSEVYVCYLSLRWPSDLHSEEAVLGPREGGGSRGLEFPQQTPSLLCHAIAVAQRQELTVIVSRQNSSACTKQCRLYLQASATLFLFQAWFICPDPHLSLPGLITCFNKDTSRSLQVPILPYSMPKISSSGQLWSG